VSDLLIFTCDYDTPRIDLSLLRRSCELYDIELATYGTGIYPGHALAKIRDAAKFLETREEPFVLFTDGADTFINGTSKSILEKYQQVGSLILVSAEKNCWPDVNLSTHYPIVDRRSPWRYINSGGWMGERGAVIEALLSMSDNIDNWGNDDQLCWTKWYLYRKGRLITTIDSGCNVFQTMASAASHELSPDGSNAVTHNTPSVYHFNGRSPGIGNWYRMLTGDMGWKGA